MNSSVAALLVSHDGARWLPAVIDGLRAQRSPVDRVVAIDTTSRDDSPELLREAFGEVHTAPGSTSFPAAVALGLEQVRDCEWVWILHDDSNPDPGALEALLAAAAADPDADILGPKLREWPSLRRLLEIGVTISGTGRRETGLERGEYDQGQHDDVHTVLAVNTAGMLVRRSVLEKLGGFDQQLPIFGNDVDFGWRAAAAGHKTIVVPAGGGLPRGGGAPRHPAHPAHRAAHPLPGAPRRAVHAPGQLPRPVAALPDRPARPRHAAADGRVPPGPIGRRVARRARRAGLPLLPAAGDPRRPAPPAGAAGRGARRPAGAAGAGVAAVPARARLRQRPRGGPDQPGPGRRRAPPGSRGRGRGGGHPATRGRTRRGQPRRGHRLRGTLPDQPDRPRQHPVRRARRGRAPARPSAA